MAIGVPADAAPPRLRLRQLDGLRGVAAVGVVLFHYLFQSANLYPQIGTPIQAFFVSGQGVELFFVISGFVIMMTLERSTLREFIASRVSRLYPAYWVAVIITFAVVTVAQLPERVLPLKFGLINLTMLQSYVGVPNVDGVYWTLAIELAFYLQGAVLWYSGLLKGRRLPWTLLAWLAVSTALTEMIHTHLTGHFYLDLFLLQAFPYVPLFIAGIAVLQIVRGGRWSMYVVLAAAGAANALLSSVVSVPWYGIAFAGLVLLVLKWKSLGTTSRLLLFLGEISYALYLIHEFVGYSIILWLMSLGASRVLATLFALAVAFGLATAITYWVDKPLRRPIRRLIAGRRRTGPASMPAASPREQVPARTPAATPLAPTTASVSSTTQHAEVSYRRAG